MEVSKDYNISIYNFNRSNNSLKSTNDFLKEEYPLFGFYCRNHKYYINDVSTNSKDKYNLLFVEKKEKIAYNNFLELKHITHLSKLTPDDIKKDIINKFNDEESIIFVLSDRKYNTLNEICSKIFSINNSLYKLEKRIKLYSIQNLNELNNINNNSEYMILGEKLIPQIITNLFDLKGSICLNELIQKLILTDKISKFHYKEIRDSSDYIKNDKNTIEFNKKFEDLISGLRVNVSIFELF